MGKRGPAPKPTALKLIDGTKESRINRDEPIPIDEAPECPADAAADVRVIWDFVVEQLSAMHLAKACDRDSLRCFCEAVVNHRKASAVLANSSILVKGIHGNWVRNPALAVQRDSANLIRAFAGEFGLTPAARSSIVVGQKREDDSNPFAQGF